MPDLSIIIVNWNTRDLLLDCIDSVYKSIRNNSFEIIVVDNASTDGSVAAVSMRYPDVLIISNEINYGFAKANNMAIKKMNGRYAVLLNSDAILKKGSIDKIVEFMDGHPSVGICGPQLLFGDGSKQTSIGKFPTFIAEFFTISLFKFLFPQKFKEEPLVLNGPTSVDFIIGACMVVNRNAIDKVGMLNESYFFYFEEIDWCMNMKKAGWDVYHLPDIEIFHLKNKSVEEINLKARAESWRSRYIFFENNPDLLGGASRILLPAGIFLNIYKFVNYSILNMMTFFMLKRLRKRWRMFAYLLVWHIKGRPVSMCIPR